MRGENTCFLNALSQGGRLPSEVKPIKKTYFDSDLQQYCIAFEEHCNYCNFYVSD